jgi:hypothetical protein
VDVELVMRAIVFTLTVGAFGACTADVAPGAYFCGPDGACPEGQACNGPDNLCVVPTQVQPFACTVDFVDSPGDDAAATGRPLTVECITKTNFEKSCLPAGDVGDWYQFDVPASCGALQLVARIAFPVAFERLALQVATGTGAPVDVDTPCVDPLPAEAPEEARCATVALTPGMHYAVGVIADGTGNCGGACANNRYTLQVQTRP